MSCPRATDFGVIAKRFRLRLMFATASDVSDCVVAATVVVAAATVGGVPANGLARAECGVEI